MNCKQLSAVLALAIGCTSLFPHDAHAQGKPDRLVKQRQAAMMLMGKYWGPLNGMRQGKAPYNEDVIERNAAFLDALSQMPWDGFKVETKSVKSRALPAVFDNAAGFRKAQDELRSAVGRLTSVIRGDEAGFKAAAGAVGKACGGCHQDFRAKK